MPFVSAFVPGLALQAQKHHHGALVQQRHIINNRPLRTASLRMSTDKLNFDEIARRLAGDLKDISARVPIADAGNTESEPSSTPADFEISVGNGGIPKVTLRHAPSGQSAEVYTYGACVTSWKSNDVELLWMSDTNKWIDGGKAIRGGIPLCFPQFGPYGDLVQHGFGRISNWEIGNTMRNEDGSVSAIFTLDSKTGTHEEIAKWGHDFAAEYTVMLNAIGLEAKLTVTNTGDKPMPFTFAFHNYFKTTKVSDARVFGFEELRYQNRLDGDREMPAAQGIESGILLDEETDRIYLGAPEELAIFDFAKLQVVKIKKTATLPNATLWNPFGSVGCDPGWQEFICVEPAAVKPSTTVAPGETWVGAQLLGVE